MTFWRTLAGVATGSIEATNVCGHDGGIAYSIVPDLSEAGPMFDADLSGQVAVITGGGRGIGRASARALGREGADLAICARTADEIDAVADELRSDGRKVVASVVDVSDWNQVSRFAAEVSRNFPEVHILLNNAGVSARRVSVAESDPAEWKKIVDVNLFGTYYVTRAFIGQMKLGGKIINVGSGMGHEPHANATPYNVSKAAVLMFTRCLALELWERGIEVNELVPGPVATTMVTWAADTSSEEAVLEELRDKPPPFSPSERVKSAAEVGDLVLWLATRERGGPTGQTFSLARRPI
jgi:3-oxoacyl-[acyl-carrier protein] reductase